MLNSAEVLTRVWSEPLDHSLNAILPSSSRRVQLNARVAQRLTARY